MNALHLISLPLDLAPLRRWAAMRGFGADEGLALHHLLSETFGKGATQPFRLMAAPGAARATLYAYARSDETNLRQTARECATPDALAVCGLAGLAVKEMPDTWRKGRRLAFDLRARPTKRLLKPAGVFPKGAEIDAYLAEVLRRHPEGRPTENPVERENVYRTWLAERLGAAATLDEARLIRFERRPVVRGKTSREGPDVIWHGALTVEDGAAFSARLASGVGRHAAFGYGMLLLRPAR
ncbi:CRISPR system Cascade subunit CasE [Rhodoblastus acidophilus]|uniref:type I-E CRISPR-associated protein Cas6/Cse3/CasE n=1 Tax=Rhodoblastus acidophilus TaxID=1074 RepID=UPI0022253A0E|nr:type I-E CRISPR-associated protein Cas6/Cse3/CasE [Rhodoblastus acidophilus]MCW2286080.1 CRISPR system Cascade subunit CasE [Rhodoblastus acidophilus]MCW2334974.1 CRISPR system Cascade subunit CasE [Rhodoblastus acidophilus]